MVRDDLEVQVNFLVYIHTCLWIVVYSYIVLFALSVTLYFLAIPLPLSVSWTKPLNVTLFFALRVKC